MGTNYYLIEHECQHCKRKDKIHIGKSSSGWHFLLHIDLEKGIETLYDWLVLFKKPGTIIVDEYGAVLGRLEMVDIITIRKWKGRNLRNKEWYNHNHAEEGVNGLARCREGRSCLGHGEGPWDLVTGEFS